MRRRVLLYWRAKPLSERPSMYFIRLHLCEMGAYFEELYTDLGGE
mgnify:CR=1 FL=1